MLTFVTKREHNLEGIRVLDNIGECVDYLHSLKEISIDIETNSLDPLIAQIFLISIGDDSRQYVIDALSIDITFINQFNHKLFIGHNIKYDYTVLKVNGVYLHYMYDTMIVEQRLGLGSGRKNALDKVILRRLGITTKTEKEVTRDSFITCNGIYNNTQVIYSGEDVEHLIKIKAIQEEYIRRFNMEFLIYDIEFPLIKILGDCELNGLVIDQEKWIEIIKEKENEERNLNKQLYEELENLRNTDALHILFKKKLQRRSIGLWSQRLTINFNSSAQLKSIFRVFHEDIPKGTRKSKTGEFEETETVGVKNIQLYLKQKPDSKLKSFLEIFVKYKKVQKHLSSFGYNYLAMISPITGRLHTVYRQTSTDTARLSCGDRKRNKAQLQQVPKLKKLRHCFGFLPGYKILTIDLSSAELVILGSKAQDFKLIELNNNDMHSYLAQASWRKILNDPEYIVTDKINGDKRTEFKNVNYGILYGAGVRKIAETLNVSLEHAEMVFNVLKTEIPNTFKYMEDISGFGVKNGYVIFNERTNSRRWFPDRGAVGKIKRASINAPIQGTQADMMKEALVEIFKTTEFRDFHLLMQVHDELVFAFKEEGFPKYVHKTLVETANKYLNGVEMKATYHIEDTWTK